jgi:hypothetical protein
MAFFSPRRWFAQFQKFTSLIPNVLRNKLGLDPIHPAVRKLFAHQLVKQTLIISALLMSLRKLLGKDKVEINPLSGDFGKIRIGNTRIDATGGYGQIVRAISQIATGQYKTRAGEFLKRPRGKVAISFFQAKTAPLVGLIADFIQGETFFGAPLQAVDVTKTGVAKYVTPGTYGRELLERVFPLFGQDILEAIRYQNIATAIGIAPLTFVGIGIQSYEMNEFSAAKIFKNQKAFEVFGTEWNNIGPDLQQLLTIYFPQINQMDRQAKLSREASDFSRMTEQEMINNERDIRYSLPEPIQKELTNLGVSVGQLQRRVNEHWVMNDGTFQQYVKNYAQLLHLYLPKIMGTSAYQNASPQSKILLLEETMSNFRKWIRDSLLQEIRVQDMVKFKEGKLWQTKL